MSQAPVAIVTGGGTGVGQATVLRLAKLGWRIVVNYSRSKDDAEQTIAQANQAGGEAIAANADVADDSQCRRMVAEAVERGELRIVLEAYEPKPAPVHFVHASRGQMPLKMRKFIDFAAPRLRERTTRMIG